MNASLQSGFPVLPFRTALYRPAELFAGFSSHDDRSYAESLDFRAYVSTRVPAQREIGMLRALHDQSISEARDAFIADRDVIAFMGGHQMRRDAPAYRAVAALSRRLSAAGRLVISGGGPGAMEATHLGALCAGHDASVLGYSLDRLAVVPEFPQRMAQIVGSDGSVDDALLRALHAWQVPAFELEGQLGSDAGTSMSIPTWFYGHEPPTPFASHIAKMFQNALREDGLLAVANHGVVYAPGRAGTLQEVFQDAAQNAYETYGAFAPMVFLDVDGAWSATFKVEPLLRELFGNERYDTNVLVTNDLGRIEAFLLDRPQSHRPESSA